LNFSGSVSHDNRLLKFLAYLSMVSVGKVEADSPFETDLTWV
jgi:hypothetical protein